MKALLRLLGDLEQRKVSVHAGVVGPLVALALSSDNKSQSLAIKALAMICLDEPGTQAVLQAGAFGVIISLLLYGPSSDAQTCAALCVLNLTRHVMGRKAMVSSGGMVPLVASLSSRIPNVRCHCTCALGVMAQDMTFVPYIINNNAVASLTFLARNDAACIGPALAALSTLALYDTCVDTVSAAGGHGLGRDVLQVATSASMKEAAQVLHTRCRPLADSSPLPVLALQPITTQSTEQSSAQTVKASLQDTAIHETVKSPPSFQLFGSERTNPPHVKQSKLPIQSEAAQRRISVSTIQKAE